MCCILPGNALTRALEESGSCFDKNIYSVHLPPRVENMDSRDVGGSYELAVASKVKAKRARPLAPLKMCEHNVRKSVCKDCARCPHDRLKVGERKGGYLCARGPAVLPASNTALNTANV